MSFIISVGSIVSAVILVPDPTGLSACQPIILRGGTAGLSEVGESKRLAVSLTHVPHAELMVTEARRWCLGFGIEEPIGNARAKTSSR